LISAKAGKKAEIKYYSEQIIYSRYNLFSRFMQIQIQFI